MKLPSKKILLSTAVLVAMSGGALTAALDQPQKTGADTSPLVQQVQHNTDQLNNHEARISNAENDIKSLQDNTQTPPSTTRTVVEQVTTPAPSQPVTQPTPPAPVTVTKSDFSGDNTSGVCNLTYSDGTTAQVAAVITASDGGFKVTIYSNNCDSFVGQAK
jgi:type II secretory pathway pseudopilin PulG